jgi:hypothetical protein
MARESNTYAKRQRETLKRQKAEAKRERRKKRKDEPETRPIANEASIMSASLHSDAAM